MSVLFIFSAVPWANGGDDKLRSYFRSFRCSGKENTVMATIHSFSLYYQLMNSCLRKLYCERICLPDSPQLVNRELHQTFYVDGNHSSIKMQALLDLRSIQMYTNLYDSWQHVDGTYQQAKPLHLGLFFDRFTVREDMSFLHPLFQPLCSCELFVRNDRFLFVQNDNTILYLQDARQIVCSHDPLSQENNVCDILDTIICNTVVETCFGYKQYFNYNEKPKSNGMLEKWKKIIHGIGYNNGKQKSNARASGSKQRCAKDPKSVKSCVKGSGSNTSVGRNGTKIKTDVLSTKIQHIETLKTNTFADKQLIVPDANAATCNFSSPTTASGSPLSRNFGPIHKNSSPASINLGMQFPTLSTCIASNQQDPILQTTAYHQQFAPHAALQNAQLTQNALSQQYAMHHNASFFREDSQRQALLRSSPISLTTHSGNNETNAIVSENKVNENEKHITPSLSLDINKLLYALYSFTDCRYLPTTAQATRTFYTGAVSVRTSTTIPVSTACARTSGRATNFFIVVEKVRRSNLFATETLARTSRTAGTDAFYLPTSAAATATTQPATPTAARPLSPTATSASPVHTATIIFSDCTAAKYFAQMRG